MAVAVELRLQPGQRTGSGSFNFSLGGDSLFGTLSTATAVVSGGQGSSLTRLLDDINGPPPFDYLEAGIMTLVPEPASVWLLMAGALGIAAWRRAQRVSSSDSGR